jgi:hypothetical protein
MKVKLCLSVFSAFLLLCGLFAYAQDLNVNGNVNLLSPNYAYQIDGNNVLRVFKTATDGSNLYLGRGAGVNLNGLESQPTGSPNVFLGNFAGRNTQNGNGNTAVGYAAGSNNVLGGHNTYLGYKAAGAYQTSPPGGPSGSQNTIIGEEAGSYVTGGNDNTFLGNWAGYTNTLGNKNIYIGSYSGFGNTTGSQNIAIGYGSGGNQTGSNNIYLSNSGGNESGTIRIGDSSKQTAAYIAGIYDTYMDHGRVVFVDSNGRLGTTTGSDPLAEMQETIRNQEQRIASLEQRLAQIEALMGKK